MNLVGGYRPRLLHEPFVFGPPPERPCFPAWLLGPPDGAPAPPGPAPGPGPGPAPVPGPLVPVPLPVPEPARLPRRRAPGPRKERRRTESINSAFAELRERIPNVPADTKLSKIKTLRLATSYIAYLMELLAPDGPAAGPAPFRAELKKSDGREGKRKRETPPEVCCHAVGHGEKKLKGRTGWPQQVWALELNQ